MFHLKFNGKSYTLKTIFKIIFKYKFPGIINKSIMHILKFLSTTNIIVFEGMTNFDGNAGEVFNYFVNDERFKYWEFIWLTKGTDILIPSNISNDTRIKCFDFNSFSLKKFYKIAKAKVVIFENMMVYTCKDNQISIYLNHGFPIKNTIGTINVFKDTKYVCCASKKYASVQEKQFSYSHDKSVFLGSPRNDAFFKNTDEMAKLSINKLDYKKIIVWMPTFRRLESGRVDGEKISGTGLPIISDISMYKQLDNFCIGNDILLLVKLHHGQRMADIHVESTKNIRIMKNDDFIKNDVLLYAFIAQTDALISDYSSVSLDYLLLDKPIGYTLDDKNDYSRGFSVDNPDVFMPGHKINTYKELLYFIKSVSNGEDEYQQIRNEFKLEFWDHQDGNSAKRVFDFICEKL